MPTLCASAKTTSGVRPHSAGKRESASAPTRPPAARSTIGCSRTTGPPSATTGSSRPSISVRRSWLRTSGSTITAAAEASTLISASSRLPSSLSERRPKAQKVRSEEHTSELQSRQYLVCRLLLEKKKTKHIEPNYAKSNTPSKLRGLPRHSHLHHSCSHPSR